MLTKETSRLASELLDTMGIVLPAVIKQYDVGLGLGYARLTDRHMDDASSVVMIEKSTLVTEREIVTDSPAEHVTKERAQSFAGLHIFVVILPGTPPNKAAGWCFYLSQ